MNNYPRISIKRKFKRPTGSKCFICGNKSFGYVWIQNSYMRGDDEKHHLCKEHYHDDEELILKNIGK